MDDDAPTGTDNVITEFENYEQFLDSQITAVDLFYLEVRIYQYHHHQAQSSHHVSTSEHQI